jgi:predicted protein tyrosine phosphatase
LGQKFRPHLKNKRVVVLGIPDDFAFMAPELVARLGATAGRYLLPATKKPGRTPAS